MTNKLSQSQNYLIKGNTMAGKSCMQNFVPRTKTDFFMRGKHYKFHGNLNLDIINLTPSLSSVILDILTWHFIAPILLHTLIEETLLNMLLDCVSVNMGTRTNCMKTCINHTEYSPFISSRWVLWIHKCKHSFYINVDITNRGLVTPSGDTDVAHYWLS